MDTGLSVESIFECVLEIDEGVLLFAGGGVVGEGEEGVVVNLVFDRPVNNLLGKLLSRGKGFSRVELKNMLAVSSEHGVVIVVQGVKGI